MKSQTLDPELQPPGAGMPFLERMIAKHFLLPRYWKRTSWDAATAFFNAEGEKIIKLTHGVSAEDRTQKILVPPQRGLEDSSRYWSIAMTLEHLVIVGRSMMGIVLDLSQNKQTFAQVDIAKVKPTGSKDSSTVLEEFIQFEKEYCQRVSNESRYRESSLLQTHPWFGGLTAHQWHGLAAVHQRTHRVQIEEIIKGLKS